MRGVVTTAASGDPGEAEELGRRFGLEVWERRGRAVHELVAEAGGAPVLVLAGGRAEVHLGEKTVRASPGMALLRLERVRRGEVDPLVRAAGLKAGERVLDATLGLAGDALVAAQATGVGVVGIEANPALAAVAQAALRRVPERDLGVAGLVEVRAQDHAQALRAMAARSFDVVVFDPMFRRPGAAAPGFDLVRALGEPGALRAEDLAQARRVARRGVVVKDGWPGAELVRLGLERIAGRRLPRIVFGWADAL